jgi:hypothetical protein
MAFLNWQSAWPGSQQTNVEILRPTPKQSGPIEVIDGDTVRHGGAILPPVGFDAPEVEIRHVATMNADAPTQLRLACALSLLAAIPLLVGARSDRRNRCSRKFLSRARVRQRRADGVRVSNPF